MCTPRDLVLSTLSVTEPLMCSGEWSTNGETMLMLGDFVLTNSFFLQPVRDVSQVEAICLISGNETEGEGMVAGDQTCKQNGGPTSVGDQLPSLPMKSSGDSQGTRRKPDLGNGLKEEDRSQANFAAPNNYSPMDCQEDQGYISRESRPSSGTPSPVLEFSGNPTVSVTINTGKCFVNCYYQLTKRRGRLGQGMSSVHFSPQHLLE
ncbi:uncharacterized protein [Narcine bancroftii]|uniref:uncharacterized protein n=1 Tax=Narcine bancroftii TaxID=1343680 RepID=UPI003832027C